MIRVAPAELYASPGRHTDVTGFGIKVAGVSEAVDIVQGLVVYDLAAKDLYGVELSPVQAGAVHERDAAALLELARTIDPRPLDQPRGPDDRIGGRCNTFTLLTVALLRAVGIPARSRCGFGAYFVPGYYEDHWVAEYWDVEGCRWTMVDAQLDETWLRMIGIEQRHPRRGGTGAVPHCWTCVAGMEHYETDPSFRMDGTVFSVLLGEQQEV